MDRNYDRIDPEKYKWGLFYYNPEDKRAVVPKRNMGLGYTLNFAQPLAWVLIIGFILVVVLTSLYLG
jgi:uncharacterized membrane protein